MNWQKARWILAGVVLLTSAWLMRMGFKIEGIGAAFPVIGSMLLLVTFALLMAPDTAFKVAEWCAKPFADIFYPSEEFEKPPLSYKLARRYSQERRVEDAVREYEKILFYYPEEKTAYLELIDLAKRFGEEELRQQYETVFQQHFHEVPPESLSSQ